MGEIGKFLFGGSDSEQQSASASGNYAWPQLQQQLSGSVNFLPAGGSFLGALLGIPGAGAASAPAPAAGGGSTLKNVATAIARNGGINISGNGLPRASRDGRNAGVKGGMGGSSGGGITPSVTPRPVTPTAPAVGGVSPQQNALQTFSDSAGMKFLEDNGNRMINNNQAAKGLLKSGATLKGIANYENGLHSQFLNSYLGHVLDFAKLGNSAANTLAAAGAHSEGTGTGSSSSKPGLISSIAAGVAAAA